MHTDPNPDVIASARPDELILMLFEGAVRFGRDCVRHLDADRDAAASESLMRVRDILTELDANLDRNAGAISRHLAAIYDYLIRRLSTPVVERDTILEVVGDIETLAQTWAVLVKRHDAELAAA